MQARQPAWLMVSGHACRAWRHSTAASALFALIVAAAASVTASSAGVGDIWAPQAGRRTVLQAEPLPLPEDVGDVCTLEAMVTELFETQGCLDIVTTGRGSDTCCSVLSTSLGTASTQRTANCLCAPDVWEELLARADEAGIPFEKFIDVCNSQHQANVAYFQGQGAGPCAGLGFGDSIPKPLPLPDKPAETCSIDNVATPFVATPNCFDLGIQGKTSEECCVAMENELGVAATAKTRNCFCVKSVWDEIVEEADEHSVPFEDILGICNSKYESNIAYFQGEGVGKCFGFSTTPKPLPLPEKPKEACNLELVSAPYFETPGCVDLAVQQNTSKECCVVLARTVGIAATGKSRNCLCVKSLWDEIIEGAAEHAIQFEEIVKTCNAMYDSNVAYFEGEGVGNCYGQGEIALKAASLAASGTTEEENVDRRGFAEWMRDIPDEPAIFVSFIFAFPSLVGVGLFFFTSSQALFF